MNILVEKALLAQGLFDFQNTDYLMIKGSDINKLKTNYSSIEHNHLDELILDKGITFNKKTYKISPDYNLSKGKGLSYEDLFELF